MVTIGMPPSSRPARTSVPAGTSGAMASAMSRSRTGSDSKRYLSKYSWLTCPERRVNSPVRWAISYTRRARSVTPRMLGGGAEADAQPGAAGLVGDPDGAAHGAHEVGADEQPEPEPA